MPTIYQFWIPRNWSIKARGHAFSSGGKACDLCLTENLTILTADQNTMLNRRDELLETCRHRRKHLLVSLFPPKKKEPPDTTVKQQGEPKQFKKKNTSETFKFKPNSTLILDLTLCFVTEEILVSRRAPFEGVMPSPYQLDAGVIISPTPLLVMILYSAKFLSQFCKCKGGCDRIRTRDQRRPIVTLRPSRLTDRATAAELHFM